MPLVLFSIIVGVTTQAISLNLESWAGNIRNVLTNTVYAVSLGLLIVNVWKPETTSEDARLEYQLILNSGKQRLTIMERKLRPQQLCYLAIQQRNDSRENQSKKEKLN